MEKKIQDLIWACLPKEVREETKRMFESHMMLDNYEEVGVFCNLFGEHNLTSDTEPKEMLHCSRDFVIEKYKTLIKNRDGHHRINSPELENWYAGRAVELKELFGDKCLPNKEETCMCVHANGTACKHYDSSIVPNGCTLTSCRFESKLPTEQPSVQGEPKFRIGQLVRFLEDWVQNKPLKVINYDAENNTYQLEGLDGFWLGESQLEPYIEPRFKVGDKVIHNHKNREVGEVVAYFPDEKFCYSVRFGKEYHNMAEDQLLPYVEPTKPKFKVGDKVRIIKQNHSLYGKTAIVDVPMKDAPEILVNRMGNLYSFYESDLEPYTEPETKDNMEEKELNLCELLSKGDLLESEFFSPAFGKVTLSEVKPDEYEVVIMDVASACEYSLNPYGCLMSSPYGFCVLFPSRALYEKYPLDAKKAWSIWASERKPKHVLQAEIRLISNDGKTIEDYENVEVEVSDVDLTQAAEAVRETLMKFHEQNQK